MSSKKKRSQNPSAKKKTILTPIRMFAALVSVVVIVTLIMMIGTGSGTDKLPGKWLRTEGDYIIESRSVAEDGTMDAGYYNPRPINVSEARVTQDKDRLNVFIELRDVNYPGSTYTLEYDRDNDVLRGTYFQAVQKQTFPVTFVRME
jgi:hypothetical protein